ncbi:MAG: zinc-ribbon domain-containing protein, partial [Chloroflexi bacterium]|nr:zinc-ribbon domain-containing protein [Chloroflexota bacterium]
MPLPFDRPPSKIQVLRYQLGPDLSSLRPGPASTTPGACAQGAGSRLAYPEAGGYTCQCALQKRHFKARVSWTAAQRVQVQEGDQRRSPVAFADKTLTCRECGTQFIFTAGEQEFYQQRGLLNEPARCPTCRATRRQSRAGLESQARTFYP